MQALIDLRPILNTIQTFEENNEEFKSCLIDIERKIHQASSEFFESSPSESFEEEDEALLCDVREVLGSLSILNPEDSVRINTINIAIDEIFDLRARSSNTAESFSLGAPITSEKPLIGPLSSVEIPRPSRSNAMDPRELRRWIASHSPGVRDAVEAAASKVRHVSQEEFEKSLGKCADQLMEVIAGIGVPDNFEFSVYGQPHKSNKWVYRLAEDHLSPLTPQSFLDAKICSSYEPDSVPKNIMIFDDATYSGEQLSRIIRDIYSQVSSVQFENPDIPMPKVWICIPFMTNKGEKNVRSAFEGTGIEFFMAEHERIDTLQELFKSDPDTLSVLDSMWGFSWAEVLSGARDMPPEKIKHLEARAESQGLIYFDHKVGDGLSFPKALGEGLVLDSRKRVVRDGFNIIPETRPPYKKELAVQAASSSPLEIVANPTLLLRKRLSKKIDLGSTFDGRVSRKPPIPPRGSIFRPSTGGSTRRLIERGKFIPRSGSPEPD